MNSDQRLRGNYDLGKNAYLVANEPAIFHCHHYNCYLQAVIQDTEEYLPNVNDILKNTAQEISYQQFSNYFNNTITDKSLRKQIVEDYFSFAGFGKIDLSEISQTGGELQTNSDHYGIGWKSKFTKSQKPVSLFTAGFLAGAIEAIYDHPSGHFECQQHKCLAMGDEYSSFKILKSHVSGSLELSNGVGIYSDYELKQPVNNNIDYYAIREAITGMPIAGSPDDGLISAFGVLLTRHYANYYTNVSNRFVEYFTRELGYDALANAQILLVEAGHVCAFNTFGGVMQSNEWNALIKPSCETPEDWLHGIVAVVNGFGWGFWEVDELIPGEKLRIKIHNGYESSSYLKKYGNVKYPISYLAQGGVAGLMNLIYTLDLPGKTPLTLDDLVYKRIHDSESKFASKQLKCRAMGDEYDLIEASKI